MTTKEERAAGRFMSRVLRHRAVDLGLDVSPAGYVCTGELLKLRGMNSIDVDSVKRIVAEDTKCRFHITDDGLQVRANQGHSGTVAAAIDDTRLLTEIIVPRPCIHGTTRAAWGIISTAGLSRMSRAHIHFASEPTATAGIRGNAEILIYVNMESALASGIKFYLSANGVILSPGNSQGVIPAEHFTTCVTKN